VGIGVKIIPEVLEIFPVFNISILSFLIIKKRLREFFSEPLGYY